MLEPSNRRISLRRQCSLLGLNRSTAYYRAEEDSAMNLRLKELIDVQYTARPFYGVERMTAHLRREGWWVNPKRVRRLMREMYLMAIYPKPRLSLSNQAHPIYPYLLRGWVVDRPDQVWASDITYIRLRGGFVYLTVAMDPVLDVLRVSGSAHVSADAVNANARIELLGLHPRTIEPYLRDVGLASHAEGLDFTLNAKLAARISLKCYIMFRVNWQDYMQRKVNSPARFEYALIRVV